MIVAVLLSVLLAGARSASAPQLNRILQNFGSWTVEEQHPQAAPGTQSGNGTEEWQAGPDGKWVLYRYSSSSARGRASALAVFWWDADAQLLRELWCLDAGKTKCEISRAVIEWRGDELVLEQKLGHPFLETWSSIDRNHHRMVLEEPGKDGKLRPTLITNAIRKAQSKPSR